MLKNHIVQGADGSGAVLLAVSPLGAANGKAIMNAGKGTPLFLNIPSLTSPMGFIDTPTILSLPLPDTLPTPGMVDGALAGQAGVQLLSPRAFASGFTPRPGVLANLLRQSKPEVLHDHHITCVHIPTGLIAPVIDIRP